MRAAGKGIERASRAARLFGTLALALGAGGCAVFPVGHKPTLLKTRPGVPAGPFDQPLDVGTTTREQLMLKAGEPDFIWDDDRQMVYQWSTTKLSWYGIVAGGGAILAAEAPITDRFFAMHLVFDDRGVLSSKTLVPANLDGYFRSLGGLE